MVLSADDLGIKKNLIPLFCSCCGNRIGWQDETNWDLALVYCEDCSPEDFNKCVFCGTVDKGGQICCDTVRNILEGKKVIEKPNKYIEITNKMFDGEPYLDELVALVKEYYKTNPAGGSLHIVLDDGNLEDNNISFCMGYAAAEEDEAGVQLAILLKNMPLSVRQKLYARYEEYSV